MRVCVPQSSRNPILTSTTTTNIIRRRIHGGLCRSGVRTGTMPVSSSRIVVRWSDRCARSQASWNLEASYRQEKIPAANSKMGRVCSRLASFQAYGIKRSPVIVGDSSFLLTMRGFMPQPRHAADKNIVTTTTSISPKNNNREHVWNPDDEREIHILKDDQFARSPSPGGLQLKAGAMPIICLRWSSIR